MNQRDLLNKISDYLSTFQLQVKISTKNSLYDINVHSETVLIPIFNILYCGDFINLNFADKNADTIDLLDRNTGIAFQVTSTSKLEKIKHTLQSYMDSKYRAEIKQLYIYILSEKQRSYSDSPLKKIIGKKIPFSVEKNILDATDLFGQIKVLSDLDQIKAIYHLLRKQFSELYILEDFTGKDFETFKAQYAKSCLTNFKRLNFFGISVSSNRPRETDLYHLFVEPRFLISNSASNRFVNLKQTQEMHYWLGGETMSLKSNNFPIQLYDTKAFSYVGRDIEMIDNFSGLFTFHKHLVILGNPGAGKSSIVKYAVCKILEQAQSVFLNHEVFKSLPIRIELH